MYTVTGQNSYLNDAVRTALNVLTDPTLTSSGILKDEGQGDGGLFKGILVRYMTLLILNKSVDSGVRSNLVQFLRNNAQSLWLKATTRPGYFYGSGWTIAPTGETDLTTDESGVMLMKAMALLNKNKLL